MGHPNTEPYIGKKFGRLTVLRSVGLKARKNGTHLASFVEVLCECGTKKELELSTIKSGKTRSCGCFSREQSALRYTKINEDKGNETHGKSNTRIYNLWLTMKNRCKHKSHNRFHLYGGKGITVCEEWNSFERFLEDMGMPPTKFHSIDRKDTLGDYCKENCRWALPKEQQNNRANNRLNEHNL